MSEEQSVNQFFFSWKKNSQLLAVFILDGGSISETIQNALTLENVITAFNRKLCEILILQSGSPEAEMFHNIYLYSTCPVMYVIGRKGIPYIIDNFEMEHCDINVPEVSIHILNQLDMILFNGWLSVPNDKEESTDLNDRDDMFIVVKFILPGGQGFTLPFLPEQTLQHVLESLVSENSIDGVTLMRGYPRVPFKTEEFDMTLKDLGFFPSEIVHIHFTQLRPEVGRLYKFVDFFLFTPYKVVKFFRNTFSSVFQHFRRQPSPPQEGTQTRGRSRYGSNIHTLHDSENGSSTDNNDQNNYNGNSTQYHY